MVDGIGSAGGLLSGGWGVTRREGGDLNYRRRGDLKTEERG